MVCSLGFYPDVVDKCIPCSGKTTTDIARVFGIMCACIFSVFFLAVLAHRSMQEVQRRRVKNILKILFVFIQTLSSLPAVFDVHFPSPYGNLINYLGLPVLDINVATIIGCIQRTNYFYQTLASTLVPFLFFFFVAVHYFFNIAWYRLPPHETSRLRTQGLGAALLVGYVFLPLASRIIFGCFACDEFDDGSVVLIKDYSLSCETRLYEFMVVFSSLMILVWPIGVSFARVSFLFVIFASDTSFHFLFQVPLTFALILYGNRKELRGDRQREVAEAAQRLQLASSDGDADVDHGITFGPDCPEGKRKHRFEQLLQWNQRRPWLKLAAAITENEIVVKRREDVNLRGLHLLFDTYRPHVWYWEIVVTLRRLVLTAAIVVLDRGSIVQYSTGIMVVLAASALQSFFAPYCEPSENTLAMLVEINTLVVIWVAFLGSMPGREFILLGESSGVGVFLSILTLLVLAVGAGTFVFAIAHTTASVQSTGTQRMWQASRTPHQPENLDAGLELAEVAPFDCVNPLSFRAESCDPTSTRRASEAVGGTEDRRDSGAMASSLKITMSSEVRALVRNRKNILDATINVPEGKPRAAVGRVGDDKKGAVAAEGKIVSDFVCL